MYDEFRSRGVAVVAISQEDKDLETHGLFLKHFKPQPAFEIVADIDRAKTERLDRTTAYLLDEKGIVREIFPMTIRTRTHWGAVLHEIDRLGLGKGVTKDAKP